MDGELLRYAQEEAAKGLENPSALTFGIKPVALLLRLQSEVDEAATFLAAVLEYLAAEVLVLSYGQLHVSNTITKEHMEKAIRNDAELSQLAVAVTA
eukprot:4456882-Prymnesium_polylepis.1